MKKILFTFISIVIIPLIFLLLIELILRLFNLFPQQPLFIEKSNHYQLNTAVAERYFNPEEVSVPGLYPERISKEKSDKTYRIFTLGGSTTAGFPFDCQVPFPQQLRYLLSQKYPSYQFEVINLGLSAVNSFTVYDLLPDVLRKNPDLILIYMGHNEFYGAYGSASAIRTGQNGSLIRFYLRIQKFHIVQMYRSFVYSLIHSEKDNSPDQTLMEKVIADKLIQYNSDQYKRTLQNYKDNLEIILENAASYDVPVIISNLISNIKDMPPFPVHNSNTDSKQNEAEIAYKNGVEFLKSGDTINAKKYLYKARDLDMVRFRASEDFNNVITKTAQKFGVPLVDMIRIFSQNSEDGIIGNELMCDHLHPNPDGYFLMAKAFFNDIIKLQQINSDNDNYAPGSKPVFVNEVDWEIGLLKIFRLKHRWPFVLKNKKADFSKYESEYDPVVTKKAYDYVFGHHNWIRVQNEMAGYYLSTGDWKKSALHYMTVGFYLQTDAQPYLKAAYIFEKHEDWRNAETCFQYAMPNSVVKDKLYYDLAVSQWKQKKLYDAIKNMQNSVNAAQLNSDQLYKSKYYLAGFYAEADSMETAHKILDALLKEKPGYKPAEILRSQLENYNKK